MCGICSIFGVILDGVISLSVSESSSVVVACFWFLCFFVWAVFRFVCSLSLSRSESEKRPLSFMLCLSMLRIHGADCVTVGGM